MTYDLGLLRRASSTAPGQIQLHETAWVSATSGQNEFCESLWTELKNYGVQVLSIPLGATRAPNMIRLGGIFADSDSSWMTSDAVAREILEHIEDGPTWVRGDVNRELAKQLCVPERRAAAEAMSRNASSVVTDILQMRPSYNR
jgi:short-subunit dehydrogenase